MVRLDDLRLAGAGAGRLDDVGIDRALGEELDAFETMCLLVEDLDEGPADRLALGLGVGDAGEGAEKACLRVDADDLRAEVLREDAHHRLGFAEAQQAVVDEYAGELLPDRAVQERGDHGGVDSAREPEQHLAATDLRAEACEGILDDVADAPERIGAADLAHEALEELSSLGGVRDLGMELYAIEAAALVAHGREGNGAGRRGRAESRWQRVDPVAVAHPHIEHRPSGRIAAVGEFIEEARGAGDGHFRVTELALGPGRDPPAELLRHGLHAVADAEHRHAELIDRRGRPGRAGGRHRLRAAGEDHAARPEGAHPGVAHVPGVDLAVHAELAHAAGDELGVLRTEIEDQDPVRVNVALRGRAGGAAGGRRAAPRGRRSGGGRSWNAGHRALQDPR